MKVESVSYVEVGQTDFQNELSAAKGAETRLFVIIFDDPVMAGHLLEQGYNMGLFREGTSVIGCDEITSHLTWKAISNQKDVENIMRGFIGVKYSPLISVTSTPRGRSFVDSFIHQQDSRLLRPDGTWDCDEDALDDSGDFFLYSQHNSDGVLCGGLQFSYFNESGENIYPNAALVYDAVYAVAYAAHHLIVVENKKTIDPTHLYATLIEKTEFVGASGDISFTSGNTYYPFDNRGNRETGHDFIVYNFNNLLYQSSNNGTDALAIVGVIHGNETYFTKANTEKLVSNAVWKPVSLNTKDGSYPVNPEFYINMSTAYQIGCFITGGICAVIVIIFLTLTLVFWSVKVLDTKQKEMFCFILCGGTFYSLQALIIGLTLTDLTCSLIMWTGHVGFFMLYGGLFRKATSELLFSYRIATVSVRNNIEISKNRGSIRTKQSNKLLHVAPKRTQLEASTSTLKDLLIYVMVILVVVYLSISTVFGVPHRDFLTRYLNLETTHEYICAMNQPVFEYFMYAIEIFFMFVGFIICILLRSRWSSLESTGDSTLVIISITNVAIIYAVIAVITLFMSVDEDVKQLVVALGSVATAVLCILTICGPPFYLILSLKLDRLLIHEALMNKCTLSELMKIIEKNTHLMYKIDRYGQNAFQVALEYDVSDEILLELIRYFLPIDPDSKSPIPVERHCFVWLDLVQKDKNVELVGKVLHKFANICSELSTALDNEGRLAVNVASQSCHKIIQESTYFCKRYEIITLEAPVHISRTCVLHLAIDHKRDGEKVALKMMRNIDQYSREVLVRKEANLSSEFTVGILRSLDAVGSPMYRDEINRRGFTEYPYCIVMPAAERDLNRIITNEHIAAKDWGQIRSISIEIALALQHLHTNGVIHGDIKSKNIVRIGHKVKLIDFDASISIGNGYAGAKYSSAFVPPEMIYFEDKNNTALFSQVAPSSKGRLTTVGTF